MRVRIPYELILKFLTFEGLDSRMDKYDIVGVGGVTYSVPGEKYHMIQMDLTDEPKLLSACYEWIRVIETFFKSSYTAYKVDIGPYEGLWPTDVTKIANRLIVHFQLDNVEVGKENWKDWFVREDIIIAPK